MRKKTKEEFIRDAILVHGDKCDYSRVEYINSATKVCVICKAHGEFWIGANAHLQGDSCRQCYLESLKGKRLFSTSDFINQSIKAHGDKYDYSDSVYTGAMNYIEIRCSRHGIFSQKAINHTQGHQCPECSREAHKVDCIYGVAINDYPHPVKTKGVHIDSYKIWRGILERCYDEEHRHKHPAYFDCIVSDEWLKFSNFKKWFDNPENGYKKDYQTDKDILVKGNRVYSTDTCCFVPRELNNLFASSRKARGIFPIGVHYSKPHDRWIAQMSIGRKNSRGYLGLFDTPELAFAAYKEAKEKRIKEMANKWKGEIAANVYEALMKYEVEITD